MNEIINSFIELGDKVVKQEEEIERLNKENKILKENAEHNDKVVDKVNWENKRLNNIINELEKTLLEWHEYWEDDDSYSWQYKNAYDYLQELKGSESNE